MEQCVRKRKLRVILEKMLAPGFELSESASYKLIKYLEQNADQSLIEAPYLSDVLLHSLAELHALTSSVKAFILKVITLLLKNELLFSKLAQMKGFHMLAENLQNTVPASAELLYTTIALATAQTSHYSGTMWLVECKLWQHLLKASVHAKFSKVADAACSFISKFVWKLDECGEEAILIEVLTHIIEPIKNCKYLTIQVLNTERPEKELYEPILPQINSLIAIVKECDKNKSQNRIFQLLVRYFLLPGRIHLIISVTQNTEFCLKLCELNYTLFIGFCTSKLPNEIVSEYYNICVVLMQLNRMDVAVSFFVKCAIILDKMKAIFCDSKFERHNRTFEMRNQFIPLTISSIITYLFNNTNERKDLLEALDGFLLKLTNIISEPIIKALYIFRGNIEIRADMKQIVIYNLKELFNLKGCLNLSQAGMIYQALYYLLQLYVTSDNSGNLILVENPLMSPEDEKILSLAMQGIKMIIQEHNINWYENVEIFCLQQALMNLLKQDFMSTKQLVQTIDLIELSIKRFLSPEMALLMESKRGSSLTEICGVMTSFMQHEDWQVRDSALQLLHTSLQVAFVKYIPLQKLISENNLVVIAARVALEDEEIYVQNMALRCLVSATKIQNIWREVIADNGQLYTQLIHMLGRSDEGIVREEILNVLTEVYINYKLNGNFEKQLLLVLSDAALNDPHWEVQLAALNFWKRLIRNKMSDCGMIDGKFPSVTFSKVKRKIVVLNEKEIKQQLNALMKDLSTNGCLTVLHECLNGDVNINVMEKAYKIVNELVEKLEFYKFEVNDDVGEPTPMGEELELDVVFGNNDVAMDLTFPSREEMEHREKVINEILDMSFNELIKGCFERSMQGRTSPIPITILPAPLNLIDSKAFLKNFKSVDYLNLLENRKKWAYGPNTLDDILDEILLSPGFNKNSADT